MNTKLKKYLDLDTDCHPKLLTKKINAKRIFIPMRLREETDDTISVPEEFRHAN
jgi:hypothetical protein